MSVSASPASPTSPRDLRRIFRDARRDPELAVLEGLHALKHALRFGAVVARVVVVDPERVRRLAAALAPDVTERVLAGAQVVSPEVFAGLAPQPPSTGVLALAHRPRLDLAVLLADERPAPVVLLEEPANLGNVGSCVRVAAAADVAGVLTTGVHDPWDPAVLRASAGLHFALPVGRIGADALAWLGRHTEGRDDSAGRPGAAAAGRPVGTGDGAGANGPGGEGEAGGGPRPLVAVDPGGEPLHETELPPRAVLAFGGERRGLSEELLDHADRRVRLPMRAGVSSLNLATAVAATLYCGRLGRGGPGTLRDRRGGPLG
jgi:TrmH family RNA methyltransferase